MKLRLLFIISFISLVAVGCTVTTSTTEKSKKENQLSDKIFNLSFQDYEKNTVNLTDFKGQSLVINSWASWCPFCVKELPDFADAKQEVGDELTIIAINRKESFNTAKSYTDELGISDDLIFVLDPKDKFYRLIGGFSMPETIFINKKGEVIEHYRGILSKELFKQKIQQIL